MANKVRFNLRKVHYAPLTLGEDGTPTWATPVPIPGAVNLTMNAEGNINPFYADGIVYYNAVANNGYSGDLEIALIPDSYRIDVLGEQKDTDAKVLFEDAYTEVKPHALLFQFDGDEKEILHVLYNTTVTRPSAEAKTTTDTKEPQTEKLSYKATPLESGLVKARTSDETTAAVIANWFKEVWTPPTPAPEG